MAVKGTFGYFFDLEKVPRRPGAKARLTKYPFYFNVLFITLQKQFYARRTI
ncbi:MAG: hypothetical protein GXY77_05615 [Fibrobacter sp.]|nr:hypothetical protein [Fibrobacter sp.]